MANTNSDKTSLTAATLKRSNSNNNNNNNDVDDNSPVCSIRSPMPRPQELAHYNNAINRETPVGNCNRKLPEILTHRPPNPDSNTSPIATFPCHTFTN